MTRRAWGPNGLETRSLEALSLELLPDDLSEEMDRVKNGQYWRKSGTLPRNHTSQGAFGNMLASRSLLSGSTLQRLGFPDDFLRPQIKANQIIEKLRISNWTTGNVKKR